MQIERHNDSRGRLARFAALRDHGFNEIVELLNGERHGRPYGAYTQWIMSDLIYALKLSRRRQRDGAWYRTARPALHVRDHVLVPDFAGWHRRWPRRTQRRPLGKFSRGRYVHAPDWICDIVEPSHADFIRVRKAPVYLDLGVAQLACDCTRSYQTPGSPLPR